MARPIATPLKADTWSKALATHPNPERVAALLKGMQQRFSHQPTNNQPSRKHQLEATTHIGSEHQRDH